MRKANLPAAVVAYTTSVHGWKQQLGTFDRMRRNGDITDEVYFWETEPILALIKVYGEEALPQLDKCAGEAGSEPNNVGAGLIASGVTLAIVGFIAVIVPQLKNILPAQLAALLP